MMTSRWATSDRNSYLGWLGLVSHEYFHAWNVKRLRPAELGPFDYERENYTSGLWISEGFTSYYSPLEVHRARLSTQNEFLAAIGRLIQSLQTTPGRLSQSAAESSRDAWIKQYRPDENTPNTTISYYTKGAVIAFLLDAKIRQSSAGARSLDDLMRLAYQRFSGARGFTPEQFRSLASEVAGADLGSWLIRASETTDELDYGEALAWYGLRFKAPEKKPEDKPDAAPEPGWLGLSTQVRNGRLIATEVQRGTPAHEAGLNVDDELIAIGDFRLPLSGLAERLAKYRPGETVSLLVSRRERLLRIEATLGRAPENRWSIELDPAAGAEQKQHLEVWLAPSSPSLGTH
jgi:predicted metalloprotease with PDZ domain